MRISLLPKLQNLQITCTMSRRTQNSLIVLIVMAISITDFSRANPAALISQCEEVKNSYVAMGYSALDVPVSSIIAKDDLDICPAGFSCCTRDMEIQLVDHSRTVYDGRLTNVTEASRRKLRSATSELHSFFTRQITKAQKDTDEMFTTAYATQYTQNKHLFDELFSNFKKYYNGEDLDISVTIHTFFKDVYLKMFSLQHPDYNFTETYMSCVGDKMNDIKPFGDIPDRLKRNLKMALMASRTFIQGMAVGRNVAQATQRIQPTVACTKAHMKMNFCPHCRGLPSLKPCANYCLNVMKGCLAYHSELDDSWKSYIDGMDALAGKLAGDGSFNLESVLNPVKDQISSAIMHYHENSRDILHKIFDETNGCGQPADLNIRDKRATTSYSGGIVPIRKTTVGLRTLVESVKVTLREVKAMWGPSLAGSICTEISATSGEKCWNGESEALYNKSIVGDGIQANGVNPEVAVDQTTPEAEIIRQIENLRTMTTNLYEAHSGASDRVSWVDLEVPLPNVTANLGEERAVKSEYAYLMSVSGGIRSPHGLQLSMYSGSGMLDSDDEDIVKGSGYGGRWPGSWPPLGNNEGSGSGMIDLSTGTHINYNENGGDPPVQPIIRPIERETPRLPAVVEAVTTQANIKKTSPSSSCRNVYSQSTLLVGLVILGLFSRYNNL